jgi:transposase-like protein
MATVCTRCGSENYRKNGSYKSVQRYVCTGCGAYFSDSPRKFTYADKAYALELYLGNVGIRKMAQFIGGSPALMVKWMRAAGKRMAEQLIQASKQVEQNLPDVIEMDEIYTFVQKKANVPSYGLLILDGEAVLLRTSSKTKASQVP